MTIETPTQVKRQIRHMDLSRAKADAAVAEARAQRDALWAMYRPLGKKPLPPFGRQWLDAGARYGPFVMCGPGAWDMAARRKHSGFAMVARIDRDPLDFDWSLLSGRRTVVIEVGSFDTEFLERLVYGLLIAGVPLVHPIRTVILDMTPPKSWPSYARDEYVAQ